MSPLPLHFYLPEKYWPDASRQEAWKAGALSTLEQSGKIACAQCWIYQTWAALQRAGVETTLSTELPTEGILVTLTSFFAADFRPPPPVFFAGIVADALPHPGAHLQIVQNPVHARRLGATHALYMPLWPQPGLLPRDPARGDRFENVGFLGDPANLAPELQDPRWQRQLHDLGLRLVVPPAARWHDYREMDAILAVRDFQASPHLHKPGTKLYNAWLAGVPFLGGRDSAYAGDGRPGENYLQAHTPGALLEHLRALRDDPALRHRLVAAGRSAGEAFSFPATLERWKSLLTQELPARAEGWKNRSPLSRRTGTVRRMARLWWDRRMR